LSAAPAPAAPPPRRRRWTARSLRSQLYIGLLAPLLVLGLANSWLNYRSAIDMAQALIDERLAGSARMIGEDIDTDENGLRVEIPPAALENLQIAPGDRVYYRVDARPGGLIAGSPVLPALHGHHLPDESWRGFDTVIDGAPMRVVVFAQPVHANGGTIPVWIQIASTVQARTLLTRDIWWRAVWPQALMLLAVALLGRLWARRALVPVLRIGAAVRGHAPDSPEPIDGAGAPSELGPLVVAINDYIGRIAHYVAEHNRFISNAAHQLKTPITVLNTQVSVGLRSAEPRHKQDALEASHATLQHCIRLIHQLLTLSAADHRVGERLAAEPTELGAIAQEVLVELAELADTRRIDLGLAPQAAAVRVSGAPVLLRAMLENLVDNALRYCPAGSAVTVSVERAGAVAALVVEDNGPGIPPAERGHVFERFYRCAATQHEEGSGLGLAIVREIALVLGARVELLDRDAGAPGLRVRVSFPAAD